MVNFGPLAAESGWRVSGTAANINGFHVLASLLHRRRSTEVNQTLRDVWPSPGLIQYAFLAAPITEFCEVQNLLSVQSCVLLYWQRYCTALEQWA